MLSKMKQYTTPEQTAKLVELGLPKPKNTISKQVAKRKIGYGILEWEDAGEEGSYSIGELIEMLPIELEDVGINTTLAIHFDNNIANVEYIGVLGIEYSIMKEELIDALYEMIVKLKEEEII
jgi:hypothetical protein